MDGLCETEGTACTLSRLRSERHGLSEEEKSMLSKYATIVGLAVALLGLTATLAPAVELTCSQVSEVWVGQPRAGSPMRTTCVMAKGPDGQEVPVTVLDSRMGEKLHCTEKGGRFAEITC